MTGEICLFNKFGFCNNGDRCKRIHLKEVCYSRECFYKDCDKRHPRPCRFFIQDGFCKFNFRCTYSHRLPKNVEDQIHKVEALEKKTEMLHKQIEDQNKTLRDLKDKVLEHHKREIEMLQAQIFDLKLKNDEIEASIKKLDDDQNET